MARIGDFVERVEPVSPETPGSVVFDRFQNEPNTLAIAVVDPEGRPVGLIERNAFTLKMAAEFGRALYARRPVSGLMDPNPPYAEAGASAETFFRTVDAAELNMLLRGFIVVENGLYVGVGAGVQILQAGAALYRSKAEEMGLLARNLAIAEAEAQASSRAKSEFLAVMSHEIRTPLHGWAGLTELLGQTHLDEQQRRYVRLLRRTAEQLSRLIGNILELAGMETGRIELRPQPVLMAELAEEMAALVRGQAGDRGQGFTLDRDLALPGGVVADESAILQVLRTLLDRFGTGAGEMVLRLGAAPPHLLVTLSGPGRQDVESSGDSDIGQSLCQNLLIAMGGTLSIRRRDGQLEALVRLPLTEAVPPAPKRRERPRHVRVLLADDVELNRLVLRGFLTGIGWSVDEAADGRQALAKAENGGYDLIVLDLRMPVMDGFAAARAIRRHERDTGAPPIPLVALSAGATVADRRQAELAGFTTFLAKPIGPDDLVANLSALLPDDVLPPPPLPPAGLEELMPAFLAEMDKDAALLQEMQAGDRLALAEHVHAMRGKCGMFGENRLFELLTSLENDAVAATQQEISAHVSDAVERVRQLRQYQ